MAVGILWGTGYVVKMEGTEGVILVICWDWTQKYYSECSQNAIFSPLPEKESAKIFPQVLSDHVFEIEEKLVVKPPPHP